MAKSNVSKATLGRLPMYLEYIKSADIGKTISATAIARALSLGEVQVRKDLNAVSGIGKPRVGYTTHELAEKLESILGYDKTTHAVIVGAGKLGKALMGYNGFKTYGLEIDCAFDSDESVIDNSQVFHVDNLGKYCKEHDIHIGILTVPSSVAQSVCDIMLDAGITAIWNFAPCRLKVPDGVVIQKENLALSLAHLNLNTK